MDKRAKTILSKLKKENSYLTAEDLAQSIQVSVKTLRSLIRQINEELTDHGACIESKYGAGYLLVIQQKELFHRFYLDFVEQTPDQLPAT